MAKAAKEQPNFFEPDTNDCPYHAYARLREEEPVWRDPMTGMYWLTRYEDIRAASLDAKRFTNRIGNGAGSTERGMRPDDPERAEQLRKELELEAELAGLYEEKGWPTTPTLSGRDEPDHMAVRRLFDHAFRPKRVKDLDPYVEQLANQLFDEFLDAGRCDWVTQYAVPLPLYVIGRQMGVPEEDMQQIRAWTDAWVQRMGLMQTPEERRWSAEQEIEAQQYFQQKYDELREQPNDSLLSELVNTTVADWGRKLSDNELHSEMMADLFVGGAETSTNALSGGMMLLIQRPAVWEQLTSDPERYLEPFVEEVLRIESPVQGLLRETAEDVELHGVTIPAGSAVCLRYGAGNRDERHYDDPVEIDLDRKQNRKHLAFGVGTHHCLGAPLARRELYYGFKVLVERVESMRFVEGENDFRFAPNFFLRGLKHLQVEFTPRAAQ